MDSSAQDTTAPRIQAFIARPAALPLDLGVPANLQSSFAGADQRVLDATGGRKGLRIHTGGAACSTSQIDIVEIILKPETSTVQEAWSDVSSQVRTVPMTLWAGIAYGVGCAVGDSCGYGGSRSLTQTLPATPAQDAGLENGAVAVMDSTAGASILTHETFHALGAVNANSLHSTGSGHVTTPGDLMGSGVGVIDVDHDDYFNPDGAIVGRDGAGVWNTYDSFYLCAAPMCPGVPVRPTVTLDGVVRDEAGARFTAAGASYYRWYTNGVASTRASGPIFDWSFGSAVGVRGFTADGAVSNFMTATVQQPPSSAPPGGQQPPSTAPPVGQEPGGSSPGGAQLVAPPAQPGAAATPTTGFPGVADVFGPAQRSRPTLTVRPADRRPRRDRLARSGLRVTVGSRDSARCIVSLRNGTTRLGRASVQALAGVPRTAVVKLSHAGRRRIARPTVRSVAVQVSCLGLSSNPVTLRLRRPAD
ncbi:MAG: hypothetical protein WKF96_16365 [Solirubrobacteraceae bacterium]